jgi:hypothetical protein
MIKLHDVYEQIFNKINALQKKYDGYELHVYDELVKNPQWPFIRIDYSYNRDRSGKNYDGTTYYQYIHVFSVYKGRKEVLEITDKINEALLEPIVTDDFIAMPYIERNEIADRSDTIGGQKTGYNTNETYRHGILVYKYVIYNK